MRIRLHRHSPLSAGSRHGLRSVVSSLGTHLQGRPLQKFWKPTEIDWSAADQMETVDANVWIGGFDATDMSHAQSAAFLREADRRGVLLYAPSFVLVEVACV